VFYEKLEKNQKAAMVGKWQQIVTQQWIDANKQE
jgi:hypothetical protein